MHKPLAPSAGKQPVRRPPGKEWTSHSSDRISRRYHNFCDEAGGLSGHTGRCVTILKGVRNVLKRQDFQSLSDWRMGENRERPRSGPGSEDPRYHL